ncbi:hypothetical protein PMAYCL1PPCAC_19576, partial [Pristionchus mayeri]
QAMPVGSWNEIKEEPLEFKEEPTDEFTKLKQEKTTADIISPSIGSPFPIREIPVDASTTKVQRVKCVVCYRLCNRREMNRFTKDPKKRTTGINAVLFTPEGRRALMELLSEMKHPYLCAIHFSPSDYTQNTKLAFIRSDAVPCFEDKVTSSKLEDIPL